MGKGGKSKSSADTSTKTQVTTTTEIGSIGVSGEHLVQLADIIQAGATAQVLRQPLQDAVPVTSFAPAPTTIQTGGGGGSWVIYGAVALAAIAGLMLLWRR